MSTNHFGFNKDTGVEARLCSAAAQLVQYSPWVLGEIFLSVCMLCGVEQ
jgi:hypothetical protein